MAQGRILVFEIRERKLHLVAEKETRGAVYNVKPFQVGALLKFIHLTSSAEPMLIDSSIPFLGNDKQERLSRVYEDAASAGSYLCHALTWTGEQKLLA